MAFRIASGSVLPTIQVCDHEVVLVRREVAEAVEVQPLADDLRFDDPAPSTRLITIAVEGEKLGALHFTDVLLALESERKPPAPMTPIVPCAEDVVDLGVTENRRVGCTRPYDDAVMLLDQGDQLFVGEGAVSETEKPPVSLAAIWSTAMLRVGSKICSERSMMSSSMEDIRLITQGALGTVQSVQKYYARDSR